MKVKFCDLGKQHNEVRQEINRAINKVIQSGDFILGRDVFLFENKFARFCKARYAAGVSSGTAALFLALKSLGIGCGDEVIVPAFTYIATAFAVSYTGAKPVFADIDEESYNIDISQIKKAITKNTKAIIPVHLYGQPADMPQILKIAKAYNLRVIEDAAQAHGAKIKMPDGEWQMAGSIGDLGCFSFYPSKNLGGMGDGGIVVTNNEESYKKLRILRDCGRISKYEHALIGYNARLDTLQAVILRTKLKRLNKWNEARIKAAGLYDKFLGGTPEIITPKVMPYAKHIYHVYAIRSKKRDKIFAGLKKEGIDAIIHYPIPLHLQRAYADLGFKEGDFPVCERIAQEIISLPIYPQITEKEIKFIVNTIKKIIK